MRHARQHAMPSLPCTSSKILFLQVSVHAYQCVLCAVIRRDLFIEMHFGPKRYVDPEPFANSLLLDHAIQQVRAVSTSYSRLCCPVLREKQFAMHGCVHCAQHCCTVWPAPCKLTGGCFGAWHLLHCVGVNGDPMFQSSGVHLIGGMCCCAFRIVIFVSPGRSGVPEAAAKQA
jgi:hypothetical protein